MNRRTGRAVLAVLLAAPVLFSMGRESRRAPGVRADAVDAKVEALLKKMTLEEKVGQLVQYAGPAEDYHAQIRQGRVGSLLNVKNLAAVNEAQRIAVRESRLGIPLIIGFDVIHGYRTVFPIPLAEACSWDPALAERTARIAAVEAAASGIRWTFAPMVDIARDARWGRIAEGSGEDPFLGAALAAARVRGFQGRSLSDPASIVACAKHFAGYGAAEGGRDYNKVDMSEKTLRETYLPPFKAAVDAGVGTFMSAFNNLNGIPASANRFTLSAVLRGEWKFAGFVVSDWNSVGELIPHGVAAGPADAAREALLAGVDMDMVSGFYSDNVAAMVGAGRIPEQAVTAAARRILRIKFLLGLFDNAMTDPAREKEALLAGPHVEAALDAARRSIVLLKNAGGVLPLRKDIASLAIIGPLADNRTAPLGPWAGVGRPEDVVTALQGIRARISPSTRLQYAQGCDVEGGAGGFEAALKAARESEAIVFIGGEAADMSGEAGSRASLDLPGRQNDLLRALHETGKPVILVLMNGRPLTLSWASKNVPAILETWFLGVQAGNAVAEALFGDANPSGKLAVTFRPFAVGQEPLYYNHESTGRPSSPERFSSRYIDAPYEPLYPFGFGLSYTTFQYGNLQISSHSMTAAGKLTVSAEVQNTGTRAGDEVVQLYVRDLGASTTRRVKELKGFERISFAPGEKKRVEFTLGAEALRFYDREMRCVVEPGAFRVWVGRSSAEGLEGGFEVTP